MWYLDAGGRSRPPHQKQLYRYLVDNSRLHSSVALFTLRCAEGDTDLFSQAYLSSFFVISSLKDKETQEQYSRNCASVRVAFTALDRWVEKQDFCAPDTKS